MDLDGSNAWLSKATRNVKYFRGRNPSFLFILPMEEGTSKPDTSRYVSGFAFYQNQHFSRRKAAQNKKKHQKEPEI